MKYIVLFFLLNSFISCSHKYQTFHTIDKNNFSFGDDKEQNLITPKMYPGKKEERSFCRGQFLFSRNAEKEVQKDLNQAVRFTCDKSDYLLNSKVTETWWTTIIYSRACIKLETHCPLIK